MCAIRIAMFDTKPYDRRMFDRANDEFDFEISFFQDRLSSETIALAEGSNVVCPFVNDTIDKPVIDKLLQMGVELIALRSAGYNNVDLEAVFKRIHVVRVPDYSPYAVAEHAVALMLSLNRKIYKAYNRTRDSNFSLVGLLGFDMHGKTAGIVGTGKIGKAVANILKGMGMEVLAYDPFPDEEFAKDKGVRYVDLGDLLSRSDIVTLHCPLTKETHHIIDGERLKGLKRGAMIINTGRGALIDTTALIDALKDGRVGFAGLDVYEEESEYFFEDFSSSIISDDVLARLLTFPNVLITSHQGFFTAEALNAIAETTLQNVRDFFEGKPLPNEICYKMCEEGCRKEEEGRCW